MTPLLVERGEVAAFLIRENAFSVGLSLQPSSCITEIGRSERWLAIVAAGFNRGRLLLTFREESVAESLDSVDPGLCGAASA